MVHGILQFTPSIAFRYVLHRCESRDIRCRESFVFKEQRASPRTIRERGARGGLPILVFLGAFRAGVRWPPKRARKRASRRGREGGASAPQVFKTCSRVVLLCRFNGLLATSRAANRPRRRDPNISPDHSIGRSDGRCVQRAGT
ncbi:hypothetical protein KY285_037416 [Solanum tuberosum]|nr:hypothetical protein KY285_037416 [Solanum tuberosum]KAH0732541.1 hypothetical protein KY289_003729 [Solanum tuberosum]KAH0732546.1 hypothetical protein KY289_003734 [Solanum tuberosum]